MTKKLKATRSITAGQCRRLTVFLLCVQESSNESSTVALLTTVVKCDIRKARAKQDDYPDNNQTLASFIDTWADINNIETDQQLTSAQGQLIRCPTVFCSEYQSECR